MRLTKEEAAILYEALKDTKYELIKHAVKPSKLDLLKAFENFENKLEKFSRDKRRNGRAKTDYFSDILQRFTLQQLKS